MVSIHAQSVRRMSELGHSGNIAATMPEFISQARNKAGDFGNTASLAWLS